MQWFLGESDRHLAASEVGNSNTGSIGDQQVQQDPQRSRKRRHSGSLYSPVLEPSQRSATPGPARILDELDLYLSEPNVPMEELTNPEDPNSKLKTTKPLEWWKKHFLLWAKLPVMLSLLPLLPEVSKDVSARPLTFSRRNVIGRVQNCLEIWCLSNAMLSWLLNNTQPCSLSMLVSELGTKRLYAWEDQ